MNMKYVAVILAALLVGFVGAAIVKTYLYPQVAILTTSALSIMIEDEPYVNGTTIDWGMLDEANTTYVLLLNVTNIGGAPCKVTFTTSGLPSGWTQTWAGNNTLLAIGDWVAADIELTTGFVDGNYSWNTYLHAETA